MRRPFSLLSAAALLAGALSVGTPASAEAGWSPADASGSFASPAGLAASSPDDPRFRPRLMGLAGLSGLGGGGLHRYGGIEGGVLFGRVGLMAIGQYGSGNDFTSRLLAGGPAVEAADLGFASLTAYGGLGRYGEEEAAGFTRDVNALFGGLSVRVPLPVGALGFAVSLWRGTLDGDAIEVPTSVRSHRFSVGFGL